MARDEAKKSSCSKRKVGAIMVLNGYVVGRGYNNSTSCVCKTGVTTEECMDVVHAEVACINSTKQSNAKAIDCTMYVTQPPCNKCLAAICEFELENNIVVTIRVCEEFLKFDDDKLRYDLIMPEWETALAEVLTHGAKKYKPNNWQQGEIERYVAATMRHWNAYRSGEKTDPDSGFPHLWHVMTNIAFLITLDK